MRVDIGLDLGGTAIKAVFVENGEIIWRGPTATASGQAALASSLIREVRMSLGLAGETSGAWRPRVTARSSSPSPAGGWTKSAPTPWGFSA